MFRGSTEIGSATSTDSRTGAQAVTNTAAQQQFTYAGALLDSPSSASAITYAVKLKYLLVQDIIIGQQEILIIHL